ncbi:MAG: beta-galactosidase [Fimbriimonadales bacterium]|nr:MAG: beta-galactosidase [Fimbriimonadales bacterium]
MTMVPAQLSTPWTDEARGASTPWPEYPRPQLKRDEWLNLNGVWAFGIVPGGEETPDALPNTIRVPYPISSALSGVNKRLQPTDVAIYRREFRIPENWRGRRVLLHFGAVDWRAEVFVNETRVGEHSGGYDSFSFDITGALESGENTLTVLVQDPTDAGYQPRGKQTMKPEGIWYTQADGIWQSVWLEPVSETHIRSCYAETQLSGKVRLFVEVANGEDCRMEAIVRRRGREIVRVEGAVDVPLTMEIPNPALWNPDSPILYDVEIVVRKGQSVLDRVEAYFGIREIRVERRKDGARMLLNGRPLFQYGVLDQGYWPDGLYTPPTDAAMRSDLEFLKRAGFNTVRKHVKVEPARWYRYCDELGLIVWQDMPNGDQSPPWDRDWTRENPRPDRERSAESARNYRTELSRIVYQLRPFPCIVMWIPFNEAWGQFDTKGVVRWLETHDRTRLVNAASGGNFVNAGSILDIHEYPGPAAPTPQEDRAIVLGEFGGLGLAVQGHLWTSDGNWGYRNLSDAATLKERYSELVDALDVLRSRGLSAAIYTQLTDVEIEVNGLLTYDRRVEKIPADELRRIHARLYEGPLRFVTVCPTAEEQAVEWAYSLEQPAEGWSRPDYDDRDWPRGVAGFGRRGTPGARVGTEWLTGDIWLRRTFEAPRNAEGELWLKLHHDEDVEVFLNGERILTRSGYVTAYQWIRLGAASLLRGRNVLAVHCRQTTGGQYVDVGLFLGRRPKP